MSNPLLKVARARKRRETLCAEGHAAYVEAIRIARDAGHTYEEIADAAGLRTRSAVGYLLNGDPRKEQRDA